MHNCFVCVWGGGGGWGCGGVGVCVCVCVCGLDTLDTLLQKNVIVFFFGNQISKWRSFKKKRLFHIFCHQGKLAKTSFNTYLTHIHTLHVFCSTY